MNYRKFGKLDWQVSALGVGCMRLPTLNNNPAEIDIPQAVDIIRYAIDHGVNYVDTAYFYHSGKSEVVVGQALRDGYRARTRLATKLPVSRVKSAADFDLLLNEQLARLQTDRLDFYLLHGLNRRSWHKVRDLGVLDWAERAIRDGRFDHLGFSFHDEYDVFQEIVDAYHGWTFCQIQYNYMDTDFQAGKRGLEYAAARGLAVVTMEPLRGGALAKAPPGPVADVFRDDPKGRDPVAWGLQWVWHWPEVALALSGMSTMAQVKRNVALAGEAQTGMLDTADLALIDRVREAYRDFQPVPCTECGYCLPCSAGVAIPDILKLYNDAEMYDAPRAGRFRYQVLGEERWADRCTDCDECVAACPQGIAVPEWLKKAHALLGPKATG